MTIAEAPVAPASPSRILRWSQVRGRVGLSKSTLFDMARKGEFPKPFRLGAGTAVGFLETDIDQWIAAQARARDAAQAEG
jgi:prophage regulatory protein